MESDQQLLRDDVVLIEHPSLSLVQQVQRLLAC
jgi:hypothetical protein